MPLFQSSFLEPKTRRHIGHSLMAAIGYILSPLSWWNDMVVNIPLAYAFSWPFSLLSDKLFLPSFIVGYWLSNLIGLVMLHRGVAGMVSKTTTRNSLHSHIIITLLYTVIIILLVWLQWLPMPADLITNNN